MRRSNIEVEAALAVVRMTLGRLLAAYWDYDQLIVASIMLLVRLVWAYLNDLLLRVSQLSSLVRQVRLSVFICRGCNRGIQFVMGTSIALHELELRDAWASPTKRDRAYKLDSVLDGIGLVFVIVLGLTRGRNVVFVIHFDWKAHLMVTWRNRLTRVVPFVHLLLFYLIQVVDLCGIATYDLP